MFVKFKSLKIFYNKINFSQNYFQRTLKLADMTENKLLERSRSIVPKLEKDRHKGQCGRIGVIGGSEEYTGAPYFAGISALKLGADLVHVFCHASAGPVIKSYSPELIVHPVLNAPNALNLIKPWLERLHILIIGPGLGRDSCTLQTVAEIIKECRERQIPLIIDADGLYMIKNDLKLIKDYEGVILTPNAAEFNNLFGSDRDKIELGLERLGKGVTVLEKGFNDHIYDSYTLFKSVCPDGGSARRCGGQGDLLAGVLATFYFWALQNHEEKNPSIVACFAASYLTKACNKYAFKIKGRSMTCTDMIEQIHCVFDDIFEHRNNRASSH